MQTTEDQTYNGWSNYATWGVALVLDNDQGTYSYVRERLAELRKSSPSLYNVQQGIWTADQAIRFELADILKDFTEDLCGLEDEPGPTLMARQVIQAGLSDVNWSEIAENIADES